METINELPEMQSSLRRRTPKQPQRPNILVRVLSSEMVAYQRDPAKHRKKAVEITG
jgi:hypothetical protein